MATNRRIKRQGLPETLADSLRERILNGDIKEGESLIQDAIAQEYDVSRMPVREALRQLEASGLVVMKLHKGAVVTSIPSEQIEELFELRSLLEGEILGRAIPRITDEQLLKAKLVLEQLENAYKGSDVTSWGHLNWEFHQSLYAAANRVQTLGVIRSINLQTDRYIRLHLILTHATLEAEKEHRKILQLVTLRDAERAVPYLKNHILHTGRALLSALRQSRSSKAG